MTEARVGPQDWTGKTPTKEQLAEILDLHRKWYRGESGGSRADLRDADLRDAVLSGADLRDADLRDADLRDADLRDAVLPDGVVWETYLKEVVPALLQAGGKSLAAVATPENWACHSWENCPMAIAFSVRGLSDVPPLYRAQANLFIKLFDAQLIPLPEVKAAA